MGKETVSLYVGATLSRHNSEQDKKDDEAWEHFIQRVRHLAALPMYKDLSIDVDASGRF